jgi:rhamnosyl/mannosyltransferase
MKILHVYRTYLPENFTGVPRVIHSLAEGHAARGIESHVFTLAENPGPEPIAVDRHFVRQAKRHASLASTDLSLSAFRSFAAALPGADIVHYHFPWPLADLLHLAHGRGKPAVVTYHSDIVRQRVLRRFYAPVMGRFLGGVDRIVATSPNYAETSPVLARYRDRLSVIPIGIPDRTPPEAATVEAWRQRLGSGFFLFVGELRYYKGATFLVEAARASGLPVVMAGRNDGGELDVAGLPANVTYLGPVSEADKEALLALCRAFVFPSHLRSEAFGVALLEAARAGRPMISCEIGSGTSYVNRDGETGIVVAPRDAPALARAMVQLAGDEALSETMGAAGRQRYEALFGADAMAESYLDLYRELLAERALLRR